MPKEITRMDQLPPGTIERIRAAGSELAKGVAMLPSRKDSVSPLVSQKDVPKPEEGKEKDPSNSGSKKPIVIAVEALFPNGTDVPVAPKTPEPALESVPDQQKIEIPKESKSIRRRKSWSNSGKEIPLVAMPDEKSDIPEPGNDKSKNLAPAPEPEDEKPAPTPETVSPEPVSAPPEPTAPAEAFSAAALVEEFGQKPEILVSGEVVGDNQSPQKESLEEESVDTPGSAEEAAALAASGVQFAEDGRFEERPDETRKNLSRLEHELEVARKRYVEVDLEKSSTLLRLRNFFGLKQGVSLEDVESVRSAYDETRNQYIQERLADVERRYTEKKSDAYKKEMADTLNFGEFEGRVKLYEARKQADVERKAGTLAGRITEKVSEYMHAYNRMKWYNKMAIGGALVGVAAAGGSLAVGAAFARGVLAGGSMSVTLDTALEANADKKAQRQAEETGEKIFQKIKELEAQQESNERADGGRDDEERLQAWSAAIQRFSNAHLSEQSEMVTKLFDERRDAMKRRKWIAGVSGIALGLVIGKGWIGSGVRHVMDHGTGIGFIDKAFHFASGNTDGHIESLPVTHAGESIDHSAGIPEAVGGEYVGAPVSAEVPIHTASGYEHFLKTADVKPGDNFWNLVKGRTSDFGFDEGRSRYFIDAIKDKAVSLTPAQIRELGISSGDISKLRPGDRIDFTRLFGAKDFDQYLSHAKGLSDEAVKHITEYKAGSAASMIDTNVSPDAASPSLGSAAVIPVDGMAAESLPTASSGVEPVFSPEYVSRVDSWYSQIFRVENPSVGQDWVFNRSEIMKLRVMDVVKDMKALDAGQWSGYKSGLAPEQYKNFYEFASQMQKSGTLSMTEFLRGNVNGTVEEYLQKAAPRAAAGARYGLFSTTG